MTTAKTAVLDEGIYVIVDLYKSSMTAQPNCVEPRNNVLGTAIRCEVITGRYRSSNKNVGYGNLSTLRLGIEDYPLAQRQSIGKCVNKDLSLCREIHWNKAPVVIFPRVASAHRARFLVKTREPRFELSIAFGSEVSRTCECQSESVIATHNVFGSQEEYSGACAMDACHLEEDRLGLINGDPGGSPDETICAECQDGFGHTSTRAHFDETKYVSEVAQWARRAVHWLSRNEDLRRFE